MRRIATSLLLFAMSLCSFAQIADVSGGPDGYGYSWISSASTIDTTWCFGCDTSTITSIDTMMTIDTSMVYTLGSSWNDTVHTGTFTVGGNTYDADVLFSTDSVWLMDTLVIISSDTITGPDTVAFRWYGVYDSIPNYDTTYAYDTNYADTIVSISGVDGPEFSWIDITTIGTDITAGLGDDNTVGPFSVGFTMPFYWYNITNYYVGANGYLAFDKKANISSGNNPSFPYFPTSTDSYDNLLAPFMADLNFGGAGNPGKVYQYSNGTDTLIITYDDVPFYSGATASGWFGSNTFQIVISKSAETITFNYLSQQGEWAAGYVGDPGAAQIGMESVGAIAGLQIASGVYFDSLLTVVISLDVDSNFSVRDITSAGNNGTKNAGIFVPHNRESSFVANVQNIGTEDETSSFNVNTVISERQNGSNAVYESTESVSSLTAGTLTEITFSNPFNPSDATTLIDGEVVEPGRSYFMVTELVLSDENNANNEQTSEVVVLGDTMLNQVNFSYVDMSPEDLNTVGQFGFEGGGIYIKPPYYPIDIIGLDYFVLTGGPSSPPTSDFRASLWDDDGASGTPGSILFETTVASGQINIDDPQGVTSVFLDNPVTITEGGFYVGWEFMGTTIDIALATEGGTSQIPLSNQNYEILSGSFGEYRSNAVEDLMISVLADAGATKSIDEQIADLELGEVYPNPASDVVSVKVSLNNTSKVNCEIKNLIGQDVRSENLGVVSTGEKVISFDVSDLETGIYFFTLTADGNSYTKKFVVK